MKRLLTILCLLIPFLGVKAGTLKGKIIDQDAQPVAGAVITYYSCSDNSILAATTCDVNGNWELSYEEAWNNIHIVARAEGYTSYTLHGFSFSMNHTWPKIIFHLFNAIDYKAGKRSTIYLPETPDASWGRFYRLDHEDGNKVVFEREHTPKAYVPYVFFPYQDLHIDISKMDLSDHHDQVRLEHISFSSAINHIVADEPGSLVTQPMDETLPYAKYSEEGAIEDYLSPAPMHAILSWMWYDFFEGNEEDGTWQAVSPEFIFHDPEPTTYHPFVEEGKVWVVAMNLGRKEVFYTQTFELKGDTLINGHVCKKMMVEEKPYFQNDEFKPMNGYLMALYEENKKVYFCQDGTTDFKLLYDFGAKEGESVVVNYANIPFYGNHSSQYHFIMGKRDETKEPPVLTLYDQDEVNYSFKTYGVEKPYDSYPVQWIEGVGHKTSPLMNGGATNLGWYGEMIDCHVGDRYLLYDKDAIDWIQQLTEPEVATYHPFVERGKRWCVHGFSMGGDHTVTDYYFSPEKNQLERNGHNYEQLCARTQDGNDKPLGWFREENQRVYLYNEEEDKEVLTYDFSLNVGDMFEPEYGDFEHCEVTKIDYIVVNGDSLKVINFRGKDKTNLLSVLVNGRFIEGIGSEMNPLYGLFSPVAPTSWSYHLAYVSGSSYWPFTFSQPYNGWWGQDLARGEEDQEYARTHFYGENDLHYELVPDPEHDAYALHVSGIMWLYCGGELYTYCRRERSEDGSAYKLYFQLDTPTDYTDCSSPYHVDLSFPFFEAGNKYIVVDEQGEHPVAVKDVSYRPLIEEGKVWRTGDTFPNISFLHLYDYYIQGDTIIDNHACKKLMRSELQYPQNYPEHIDTTYAASLYEEGQRVYVVLPGESHLELAYDFASPVGSHIDIDGFNIIVTRKEEKATGCFKGRCTYVGLEEEYEYISFESCWIEGVGVALNPLYSLNELLPTGLLKELLIFCFVNDEVLYYNSDIFDGDIYGLTPQAGEVKKQWIDFTHIKKPRPKAPAREGTAYETDEENLTGEYSAKELFVNLKILSGAYTVTLKDAAGNEVYRKEVQTSSTIALNTDLTKYPEGTYTLILENSDEQYTATLTLPLAEVAVRDIPASEVYRPSAPRTYYDLSGRRLSTPPAKGIYIRDGKKVVVR